MCRGEKVVFYDFKGWKGSPWSERKLFSPEEEERIIKGVTEGGAVSNRDRTVLNIVFRDG